MANSKILNLQVTLKGRIHHRQGDLNSQPCWIDRQAWNAKDANALIVYDSQNLSLGFIDKDTASMLGPLIRAGYIQDLQLIIPKDFMSNDSFADIVCDLAITIESLKAAEFDSLASKNLTFGSIKTQKQPSTGLGFIKASQLRPAKQDPQVIEAKRRLDDAIKKRPLIKSNSAAYAKKPGTILEPRLRTSITSFFTKKSLQADSDPCHLVAVMSKSTERISLLDLISKIKLFDYFSVAEKALLLRPTCRILKSIVDSTMEKSSFRWRKTYVTGVIDDLELNSQHRLLVPQTFNSRLDCVRDMLKLNEEEQVYEALCATRQVEGGGEARKLLMCSLHDELIKCYHLNMRRDSGKQCLTSEQERIVNASYLPGSITRITAYAGAGKTSTLLALAESLSEKQILYLCFNKSVQQEAESRFPGNVQCRTVHSLAFEIAGYKAYACEQMDDIDDVATWFGRAHGEDVDGDLETFLSQVRQLLNDFSQFLNSSADDPDEPLTREMWEAMKRGKLTMTYSGVLKLSASKKVKLPFDIILLDEAQDCNPCALDIFMSQDHAARVLVGDPHQAIYGFTSAKNALALQGYPGMVGKVNDFVLSRSFRFGPTLAHFSARFLNECGRRGFDGKDISIRGVGEGDVEIINHPMPLWMFAKRVRDSLVFKAKTCFIARTNATLLEVMVETLEQDRTVTIGVLGGLKGARLDDLYAVARLAQRESCAGVDSAQQLSKRVRPGSMMEFPDQFTTMDEFVKACRKRGSLEWLTLVKILRRWGIEETLAVVQKLKHDKRVLSDPAKADIVFSTVHKSKGLEFDGVFVADDFDVLNVSPGRRNLENLDEETVNLMYVAFTRAKRFLHVDISVIRGAQTRLALFGACLRPACSGSILTSICSFCGTQCPGEVKFILTPVGSFKQVGEAVCDDCANLAPI